MALTSVETFYSPEDAKTVIALLDKHEDSALIVAGGTFLHGLVSRGLLSGIEALINIQNLGLDKISVDADKFSIGATTVFAQLKACQAVQEQAWLGAVKDAVDYPPVQIMNSATVGGSIASSCPYFDLPVSFLALDGSVEAQGGNGERTIPLEAFFSGLFENALESNEFVTGIRLPVPQGAVSSAFIKMETNANDLAILNVAVSLALDEAGSCRQARIFLGGGVGEAPVRSPSAEKVLTGVIPDDAAIEKAGDAVLTDVEPLADHRASAEYRRAMSKVLLQRALRRAIARLSERG